MYLNQSDSSRRRKRHIVQRADGRQQKGQHIMNALRILQLVVHLPLSEKLNVNKYNQRKIEFKDIQFRKKNLNDKQSSKKSTRVSEIPPGQRKNGRYASTCQNDVQIVCIYIQHPRILVIITKLALIAHNVCSEHDHHDFD